MNKCYALVWNVSQGCWNVVSEGSRRRGKPAGAKAAIASALALLGATALAPAYALPSGGTVVGGSANGEIHLSGGNSLSVNQKVDKLIANWDSFSVAAGERVIFNQPSSSSIALNRVIGTKASDIQGRGIGIGFALDAGDTGDAGLRATGVVEEEQVAGVHAADEVARLVVAHAIPAGGSEALQVADREFVRLGFHQPVGRHELCSSFVDVRRKRLRVTTGRRCNCV